MKLAIGGLAGQEQPPKCQRKVDDVPTSRLVDEVKGAAGNRTYEFHRCVTAGVQRSWSLHLKLGQHLSPKIQLSRKVQDPRSKGRTESSRLRIHSDSRIDFAQALKPRL